MFKHLVGNEETKSRLRRMIAAERVPGALLFAGASGVGKRLFAIEIAKQLNCLNPTAEGEACDMCSACKRIAILPSALRETVARYETASRQEKDQMNEIIIWSQHRDVGAITSLGKFIVVPQARSLEREANFRPNEGRRRVFIIDDADRMNEAASNALLKTLEEMPATTHLILISSRPDSLLKTIRSRCQTIRFAPIADAEIEQYLIKERKRAGDDARLAARLAQGDLAFALEVNLDVYQTQREQVLQVLDAIAMRRDRARLLRVAEELSDPKRKDDFENALDTFEIVTRDVWRLALSNQETSSQAATMTNSLSIVNEDLRARLVSLAATLKPKTLAAFLQRIDRVRRELAVNINKRIAADALLLGMTTEV